MVDGIDAGAIWRSQVVEDGAPPVGALREKAETLRWQARWRVLGGYGWGAFFAAQFGFDIFRARNGVEVAGDTICVLGAAVLAVVWRRFAIGGGLPHDLPVRGFLVAYRDELVRQQRLARTIGVWSVLPITAGLVLTGAGHLAARHALNGGSLAVMVALGGLVVGLGWVFGRLQAQQTQFRIDEVEAALRAAG